MNPEFPFARWGVHADPGPWLGLISMKQVVLGRLPTGFSFLRPSFHINLL
jgi:hypothetical protein